MVVVSAVVSAMFVLASPASADEVLDGSYSRIYLNEPGSTYGAAIVELTPCGLGCTFWKMLDNSHPGFPMYLQGNRWVDTRDNGLSHSFDKDTLIGVTRGEVQGRSFIDPWMLVKNE
jgi:hypothetical protein